MTSNRKGQSQSALRAVQGRHEAIQKIERQMIELAQLFQDMEAAVVQQEPAVEIIDQKAEDTHMNISKGNEQLDQAVVKAAAARRKKWICLGIFGTCPLGSTPQSALRVHLRRVTYGPKSSSSSSSRPSSSWCSDSPPMSSNEHFNFEDTILTVFSSYHSHNRGCDRYCRSCHTEEDIVSLVYVPSGLQHRRFRTGHKRIPLPSPSFSSGLGRPSISLHLGVFTLHAADRVLPASMEIRSSGLIRNFCLDPCFVLCVRGIFGCRNQSLGMDMLASRLCSKDKAL